MNEHLIITPTSGDYVRIVAEQGYKLFSMALNRFVSEAVVLPKQVKQFKAVAAA